MQRDCPSVFCLLSSVFCLLSSVFCPRGSQIPYVRLKSREILIFKSSGMKGFDM